MRISEALAAAVLGVTLLGQPSAAQAPPADPVVAALTGARSAYEQRNYNAAADQLRNLLKNHAQRPEAVEARYLLALALLESQQPDYAQAGEALAGVIGAENFADRPQAIYFRAYVLRALAVRAQANADAANAPKLREQAQQLLSEAAKHFAASGDALAASKTPGAAQLMLRSRCDQAESLIRLGQFKEALALIAPLSHDTRSRYGRLLSYYGGYSAFALGDLNLAGRFLSVMSPFDDPVVGLHARFLMARTHHLSNEAPEALEHYSTILAEIEKLRQAAEQSLRTAGAFHDRLDERWRIEGFLAESPDLYWRTLFYGAALGQERGKAAESAEQFAKFLAKNPQSPLAAEAKLRLGLCRMELKRFDEAGKLLGELAEHPLLGDQALWHGGRARMFSADPGNPAQRQQQLAAAIDLLTRAAARAQQMGPTDPDAKLRRGEILHDLGEAQFQAGKLPDAAVTFQAIVDAAPTEFSEQLEPAMSRLAGVLSAAGQLDQSDAVCQKFIAAYPRSAVLPAVMFRFAENAMARAVASQGDGAAKLFEAAIARYRPVIEKFPEYAHASQARFGMAQAHLRQGRVAEAAALLSGIPQSDRQGSLAHVPYMLADCLIRTMPENTDDALAAGRVLEQADTAAKLLAEFVSTQPSHPQVPEALVRLGECRLKVAAVLVDPEERTKNLRSAREACDQVIQKYLSTPAAPMALMTSARAAAELNDWNGAINLLWRFNADPFRASPVAPLAMVQLAEAMRKVGRAGEAVNILTKLRGDQEATLRNDPARAGWVPRLRMAHGLALKDAGKYPEAQAVFDSVIAEFAGKPEAAEARWRGAQLRKDQAGGAIAGTRQQALAAANAKDLEAALATLTNAIKPLAEAVDVLVQQAKAMDEQGGAMRLAALADAADGYRKLADGEVALAMGRSALESMKKLEARRAELNNKLPGLPPLRPLEPPLPAIPLQPSEQKARAAMKALIEAAGESPQAIEAMISLHEMYAARGEVDAGIGLLKQAIDQGPPPAVADRLKVLLGEALLAKGQGDQAAALFEPMAQNYQHPMYPRARLGFAISLLVRKDYDNAAARLARFRDKPELSNIPGVTDLALFRLGEAHAALQQWDAARAAWNLLIERFGNSAYRAEARFRMAEALRQLKQHDAAVDQYTRVIQRAGADVSARSQYAIGLCRLEQGRPDQAAAALLAVSFSYENADLSATALYDAAGALIKAKKPEDAKLALNRLLADQPTGPWAEKARQRLAEIK